MTVIVGDEVHPSLVKGLGLLGLGRARAVRVPVDGQGRMRADALPAISGPTIVCVQAGNVNTGAFDPVEEIAAQAHEAGAWVHVDGAFGLWAAVAPERAHLVRGVGAADSWATDAHKWLNVPYDSGLAFVRDPEPLRAAMGVTAAYLPDSMMREPAAHAPELSRRARGVEVWAVLRALGRSGLADLVERDCRHATAFAEGLVRRRLRDPERRRAQPGAGLVRRRGRDAPRRRRHPGGRHLLGRRDGVAGPHGHAHQRLRLVDHRGRRGAQPRGDAPGAPADAEA